MSFKVPAAMCVAVVVAVLGGCSGKPADTAAASTSAAGSASPAAAAPAGVPVASHAAAPSSGESAQGTVLETINAAQYTYVRVKTASGEIWAASSPFKVAVGDVVTVPLDAPMQKFHSPSLNRDFDLIYFASSITRAGDTQALPGRQSPVAATAPETTITEPISPPRGGITLATLWANRNALKGRTVTVRGKVVKFNGGILGLNWTHIQDGTGVAGDGTNDITITSAGGATVGDIVTVTGTVELDKDFGAGYAYKVMLQNATITVK